MLGYSTGRQSGDIEPSFAHPVPEVLQPHRGIGESSDGLPHSAVNIEEDLRNDELLTQLRPLFPDILLVNNCGIGRLYDDTDSETDEPTWVVLEVNTEDVDDAVITLAPIMTNGNHSNHGDSETELFTTSSVSEPQSSSDEASSHAMHNGTTHQIHPQPLSAPVQHQPEPSFESWMDIIFIPAHARASSAQPLRNNADINYDGDVEDENHSTTSSDESVSSADFARYREALRNPSRPRPNDVNHHTTSNMNGLTNGVNGVRTPEARAVGNGSRFVEHFDTPAQRSQTPDQIQQWVEDTADLLASGPMVNGTTNHVNGYVQTNGEPITLWVSAVRELGDEFESDEDGGAQLWRAR